jgi:hypothetical protein
MKADPAHTLTPEALDQICDHDEVGILQIMQYFASNFFLE